MNSILTGSRSNRTSRRVQTVWQLGWRTAGDLGGNGCHGIHGVSHESCLRCLLLHQVAQVEGSCSSRRMVSMEHSRRGGRGRRPASNGMERGTPVRNGGRWTIRMGSAREPWVSEDKRRQKAHVAGHLLHPPELALLFSVCKLYHQTRGCSLLIRRVIIWG